MANLIFPKRYTIDKPPLGSQLNWSHPLSQGLVGCWLMNEGGGNVVNNLAYPQLYGVLKSTATFSKKTKGSSLFNSGNYYGGVSIQNKSTFFDIKDIPMSCSAWLNLTSTVDFDQSKIFSTGYTGGVNGWWITTLNDYRILFTHDGDTTDQVIQTGSNVFSLNKDFNFVLTHKGTLTATDVHIYIDGKEVKYTTQTNGDVLNNATSTNQVCIGNGRATGINGSVKGHIYNAMYWRNRVLSPSEIRSLYEAPYQMIAPRRQKVFFDVSSGAVDQTITPSLLQLISSLQDITTNYDYVISLSTLDLTAALTTTTIKFDFAVDITALAITAGVLDPTVSTEAGRTYLVFNSSANRLELWVGGTEVARFNQNGAIDVNGAVNQNAF